MKTLLIEKNGIYIENSAGDVVSFKDLADLHFYTGTDLRPTIGTTRVGYEPDRGIHTEFDGLETITRPIPDPTYEQLLANVDLYASRKADPLYGLAGLALFERQRELDETLVRQTYAIESAAPVTALGHTWNGGQDSAASIQGAISLAQALGETDVQITDIDNVAHTLAFTDALAIAAAIGQQFRAAFFKKQAALVEIAGRVLP